MYRDSEHAGFKSEAPSALPPLAQQWSGFSSVSLFLSPCLTLVMFCCIQQDALAALLWRGSFLPPRGGALNWIYLCPVEACAIHKRLSGYTLYSLAKKKDFSCLSAVKEGLWEMSLLSLPHKGDMKMKKLMFWRVLSYSGDRQSNIMFIIMVPTTSLGAHRSLSHITGVCMVSLGKDNGADG